MKGSPLGFRFSRCSEREVTPEWLKSRDGWRGALWGWWPLPPLPSYAKEDLLTGEMVTLGLLNLTRRSPGDYRAPGVQTPYAFFKRYHLCLAPVVNELNINLNT